VLAASAADVVSVSVDPMSRWPVKRLTVGLAGVLASTVFVWLALRHVDLRSLVATWREARPMPWIVLAVLFYVAGHLVRGRRLRVLVQREATLSVPTASNLVVVGYASNNVFPARLGEFVRAGMLAERTGIPLGQSLTITFIERMLDGIAILLLLVVGAVAVGQRTGWIWQAARFGGLVFGIALLVVLGAIFLPHAILSLTSRLTQPFSPRWRDRGFALMRGVINGGACLRRPADVARVAAYSLLVWLLESAMFACVLPIFAMPLRLAPAIVAMSVTNLGILFPSTPGYIGPFHYFCSQALIAQGVPETTALSYAVMVHLAFFVPVTLWGAGAMLWYGVQVGATAAMAQAARAAPVLQALHGIPLHVIAHLEPPPPRSPASRFQVALTEAVVAPPGGGPLSAHVADVATFVAQELDALPARLRAMFAAGMLAFRVFVRLRFGRGFCRLDLEHRQAAVDSWAFSRIALLRQLFRPVRSIALLAYWESETAYGERSRSGAKLPVLAEAEQMHG
jgi:uncharacterized protein (TIRG00374 family)